MKTGEEGNGRYEVEDNNKWQCECGKTEECVCVESKAEVRSHSKLYRYK